MKFAQEAAKYFPDVEVIEMHHADKKDAPSGTALSTAKMIAQNRQPHESNPDEVETLATSAVATIKAFAFTRSVCRATLPMSRCCLAALARH